MTIMKRVMTVSYTHLDVYKRQILGVLVSMDMLLLALFWTLSLVPLRLELARQRSKLALTAFNIVLLGSAVPMLLFVIGLGVLDALQPHLASPRLPFDLLALDLSLIHI